MLTLNNSFSGHYTYHTIKQIKTRKKPVPFVAWQAFIFLQKCKVKLKSKDLPFASRDKKTVERKRAYHKPLLLFALRGKQNLSSVASLPRRLRRPQRSVTHRVLPIVFCFFLLDLMLLPNASLTQSIHLEQAGVQSGHHIYRIVCSTRNRLDEGHLQ